MESSIALLGRQRSIFLLAPAEASPLGLSGLWAAAFDLGH
jgi:hypothetical protein